MKHALMKKSIITAVALAALLMMLAWLSGSFDEKITPQNLKKEQFFAPVSSSDFYVVNYQKEMIYEPVSAAIEAKQATIISSRILANIESIKVRAGEKVNKGDVLIELEKSALLSQVSQAQEKIKSLAARYQEAEKNLTRAQELHRDALISAFELDKHKADFQSRHAELTAAKAAYEQAQASLSYARIISPISGRIIDRFSEPGDTAQPGKKLLALYNPLSLRIAVNVREQLAVSLQQGQELTVEIPSINKKQFARVEEIIPAANTGSRSFLIKAAIDFDPALMPGMYARVLVPTKELPVMYVPNDKIKRIGQLTFVWVLKDKVLERRFVRLGKANDKKMTRVLSGLEAGDVLIAVPDPAT